MAVEGAEFDYVSALVREEAAIVLERGKEYLVEARLAPLARAHKCASLSEFIHRLRSSADPKLRYEVVEALTTNETSFFRDVTPFDALRETVLPELIAKRRGKNEISIWCAASSTGQEPYSLAMLLRDRFPEVMHWKVRFIATDISSEVLERARNGIFSQLEVNRGLPVAYLVKYFDKVGQDWRIKSEIRSMVHFQELNLIKPFTLVSEVDLVMIRNVLIYFDVAVKKEILGKIRKVLRPDGYLFLGAAETTLNLDDSFERRPIGKSSCYQKRL